MALPTQHTRIAELTTPLGKDRLVLFRFDASEGMSELFTFNVDCGGEQPVPDLGALIGKESSVRIYTVGGKTRYFSGIVVEARQIPPQDDKAAYRLTLRPWTWLLGHASESRIFQNKSVVDIIKEVFKRAGFASECETELSESYPPLEYCVQYHESHLAFVLRLMEQYGIYYYFKHTAGKHTMVLVDSMSTHKDVADLPTVDLIGMGERTRDNREFLRGWASERTFQTGKATMSGFDFAMPDADMTHAESKSAGYAKDNFEVFVYPHKYKQGQKESLGKKFAKATLESRRARDRRRYAEGNAPSLFPGGTFKLQKSKDAAENGDYLVIAARHSVVTQLYRSSGDGGEAGEAYSGNYLVQPKDVPYRAPQVTPRPVVHGPQTALVVGPEGEEIHTDKYGRVKVLFDWDRELRGQPVGQPPESQERKKESASRWVRVAHTWSGKEWGSLYIPRIGMEVVVEFIEGDPDRPLVIGTVYNANNMPPVSLPTNKTQRGLKTRSSTGGNPDTYNELWYEDKKGEEFVRFHAEKDYLATIEDTEKRTVKGKNRNGPGDTARSATIEKGDDVLKVNNGDRNTTISRHHKVDIGSDETVTIGNNQTHTITNEIMIEAGQKLTLKVGGSTIVMTPSSIEIKTSQLTEEAIKIEINASALLDAKGGIIKLNS